MYRRLVHPIERLRYVARAGAAPDHILVAESVPALSAFARRPGALLVALRQLIVRQPSSPGLLGLAAHMVHSLDPVEAGWAFAAALEGDRTSDLAEEIAMTEAGGTDVIDSIASGPGVALCPAGTTAWIEHARRAGRSIALVAPVGTRLPKLLWASFVDRNHLGSGASDSELIGLDQFDDLIGPEGITPISDWVSDCPDVAEVARL